MRGFQHGLRLRIHFYAGWQFFLFLLCSLLFGYDWRGQRFSRFPNANSNSNGDAYAHAHADAYPNAHADGDAHPNTYAHAYPITDAHAYPITDADTYANTDAQCHTDTVHGKMFADAEAASDSSAASHGAGQSHATRSDSSYVHSHACCALDRATACVLPAWLLNPSPPDEKDGSSESRSDFRAL